MNLAQLIEQLPIDIDCPTVHHATVIQRIEPLNSATPGALSFLASAKYRRDLAATQASAVFLTEQERSQCPEHVVPLVVADPYLAYAFASHLFDPAPRARGTIHKTALIDPTASVGDDVTIDAYAVIEANAIIEDRVQIGAHTIVGEASRIGRSTRLHPRVTIAHQVHIGSRCIIQSGTVIGSTGFGYAPNKGAWQAIAQIGHVIIGDRVEIGANCTVDRGAIEPTIIEDDVIIDNQIQIGHNVKVGRGCAMAAQVGIAGSTIIGSNCTIGGQSGFAGHLSIADNSHFTGQAMVTKGTTEGGLYSSGIPAQANSIWRKTIARLRRLDQYAERIDAIENTLKDLK